MKNLRSYYVAFPLVLALAACQPAVATYTTAEAPHKLALSRAERRIAVHFYRHSARLVRGEAHTLKKLAALGILLPSDRVSVAAAGPPRLAAARIATISRTLLPSRIVIHSASYPWIAHDRAIITVDRALVTLPACPNWSGPSPERFNNQTGSNFGCATATNLGVMVASPADLVSGEPLGSADAKPAVLATDLYLVNKVPPPGGSAASGGGAITPSAGAGVNGGS